MIALFRIDERLIHGQIAIKWAAEAKADRIIVANDAAAENELMKKSLLMAAPPTVKTIILPVDKAIELLGDPRCGSLRILLLANGPKDACRIAENVDGIPYINVGNYGRIAAQKDGAPRKAYANNIYCNDEDVVCFRQLLRTGLKCIYQTIPEEPAVDVTKYFGDGRKEKD
ncbi:MAG: PTS sugar transporter subunit IIB [Lachnospiraceae bacterium]|nr:PTS sugar transporter subunit IIB [Lachnospiraceae bacterium]